MDFNDIIGQNEVINSLQNSMKDNKVGHAYIFSGPKGIGKKTIARIFAAALMCEKHGNNNACGKCASCGMLEKASNPDYREITPDGTSIGVDEIRSLQSDIIIKPLYSGRKVYLIIEAENMTVQAQNCLLKTLEEPPGYAVIILTTSNYSALLETIRSRAVRCNFKKNSYHDIYGLLKNRNTKDLKSLDFIASYADGVIGTALELAESDEFVSIREKAISVILKINNSKTLDVFDIYDEFFETNKNSVEVILDIMLLFYRDLLIVKNTGKENVLINSDKKDIILSNVSKFSMQKLINAVELVELTRKNIKNNANYQLSIEVMLMKLQEEKV